MDSIRAGLEWVNASEWTILLLCVLMYVIFLIRFVIHELWILGKYSPSSWPVEIPVPADVKVGIGSSIIIACITIAFGQIAHGLSAGSVLITVVVDLTIAWMGVEALSAPLRGYRRARRQMADLAARREKADSTEESRSETEV